MYLAATDLFNSISMPNMTPAYFFYSLGISLFCGLFIYLIYRFFYKGIIYSHSFNLLLIIVTLTTSFIILSISTNIALSLGVLGSLSIIRFRTAIKDPLDVGFLFLSVAAGLASGAGLFIPAIAGTIVISIVIALISKIPAFNRVYLLIVSMESRAEESVLETFKDIKYRLKNKTVQYTSTEMTFELRLKPGKTTIVNDIAAIDGVLNAVMVEYSGDYAD